MKADKSNEAESNFLSAYRGLSKNHRLILEGVGEWLEVLEALADEGKEVAETDIIIEHDLYRDEVRFKHIWKLKDAEE